MKVTPERGFSGGCLPKDLDGLIAAARATGEPARLLQTIARFNGDVRRTGTRRPDGMDGCDA